MKTACAFLALVCLVGCGSAAEIAAALRETPVPAQPATSIVVTAKPTVMPPSSRDMYDDYKKVAKGMTRDEVIAVLGTYQGQDENTFCDNGECKTYEYLSWYYNAGKIGVTIVANVAVYTYTM